MIFSASDNSDPRTNGRQYEFLVQPALSSFGTLLIVVLPVFALLLQRFLFPASRLIYGLGAMAAITYASFFLGRVTFGIDTITYVIWSPWVPLGYPFFLSAVKTIFGGLRWAGILQMTLLVCACTILALSVERLTARRFTSLAALLILLCNTPIFLQQGILQSEALFVPLLILNVGAAFLLIAEGSKAWALMLATTAALAMFVRPAGYYIPLGIIFLLMVQRERFWWTAKWALLPFVALMLVAFLVNFGIRGNAAASQTGRILFPHVAFLFDPEFSSETNKKFAYAIERTIEARRAEYSRAQGRPARIHYSMFDYNSRTDAMDSALNQQCSLETGTACSFEKIEAIYREFFFSTIQHRPMEYLQMVIDGLIEAWRNTIIDAHYSFTVGYAMEAERHATLVEQINSVRLPLSADDIRLDSKLVNEVPGHLVDLIDSIRGFLHGQRWLIYIVGIVTLFAMPIALRTKAKHWLALGYCGVIIHGSMLLTAAVTVFIPRYASPIDPIVLIAGLIMLDGVTTWAIRKARTRPGTAIFGMTARPDGGPP